MIYTNLHLVLVRMYLNKLLVVGKETEGGGRAKGGGGSGGGEGR